jgi:hypothetical protein
MTENQRFMISLKWICSGLFSLLVITNSVYSQDFNNDVFSFEFRGERLSSVLEEVAENAGLDLVYDPALVRDLYIHKRIRNLSMPELLQEVLLDTPLDFITLSTGTIVIVETVRDEPAYGSLSGRVIDSTTGDPLPGANVMFADASGGTSTNRAGNFSLNRLVSGSYHIIFSYVGYEPVFKTVDILPDQQQREEINLDPKPVHISPVIVTSHVPQMPRMSGNDEAIFNNDYWDNSGGMRNAIQSLNLFSGVQYGLPMTDLHLQGGQRGDHRMLLDGVPVYNPYSFGQMFSAFSPHAINKVNLHKAGYGVQEGSQIAGLIDLHHDVSAAKDLGFTLQGDPLSLNTRADVQIPIGNDSPVKVMSAFRTNYWNIYRNPTLDQTLRDWDKVDPLIMNLILDEDRDFVTYETMEHNSDVRFHDFHLASRFRLNSFHNFNASFYTGRNFVSTDLLAQAFPASDLPDYTYANDQYNWQNLMGQLSHNWFVTPRLDLSTRLSYSSNSFDHQYLYGNSLDPAIPEISSSSFYTTSDAYRTIGQVASGGQLPTQFNENDIRHFILRSDATYNYTRHFTINMGLQLDRVASSVNLSELFYRPIQSDQTSILLGSYVDGRFTIGEYWNVNIGSRFTYVHHNSNIYLEPRAGLQYDLPDVSSGYWSFRISGGIYRQFINQFDITNVGPTALVPSFSVWSHSESGQIPKAYHTSGSILFEPDDHTSISFEAFKKWQPVAYITSYQNLFARQTAENARFDTFAESTSMSAYGGGIRLTRDIPEMRIHLMLGYDYSISNINEHSQYGRTMPASWNEPHRFQGRALWHIHPALSTIVQWQTVAGRTWGYRQAYYDFLHYRDSNYLFLNPEKDRLSPFHQLDFSVVLKPTVGFSDLEIRLDLVNILNRSNVIDWGLQPTENPGEYDVRKRTMPGFTPSVSLQFNF